MSDKKILPPALAPFVMQWGELGSAWGIGRSAARIHGLLLVSDRSLTADEIVVALDIARSNVSMSMKDLRAMGLVETQPSISDRKERFTAIDDPIEIAQRVAEQVVDADGQAVSHQDDGAADPERKGYEEGLVEALLEQQP